MIILLELGDSIPISYSDFRSWLVNLC